MKVSELIAKIENEGFSLYDLEINTFLTTDEMYMILDDLKNRVIVVKDNGIFEIDMLLRNITINLAILDSCTNIEFDDGFTFEQYDLLRKHKVFQTIYEISEDKDNGLDQFLMLCDSTLEQEIKLRNSIEGLIANGIMNLLDRIPNNEQMLEYIKEFKGFNPETVSTLKNLFEFANTGTKQL